jgi:hypothetical protein
MAERQPSKDLIGRLADAGEEAFQRLADATGADRVFGVVNTTRDRLDEMQKKVRGIEALERRVVALEKRLDKLEGKKPAAAEKPKAKAAPRKKPAAASSTAKSSAGPSGSGATPKPTS